MEGVEFDHAYKDIIVKHVGYSTVGTTDFHLVSDIWAYIQNILYFWNTYILYVPLLNT